MIIVKTKNGDSFINDKAVTMVDHDREYAAVAVYCDDDGDGASYTIEDVEGIIYTSDAQPVEWKDEGSEIQRLKAKLEKQKKKYSRLCDQFEYWNHKCYAYESAIMSINEWAEQAEQKGENMKSLLDIIEAAEKKCKESYEKLEDARKKWKE